MASRVWLRATKPSESDSINMRPPPDAASRPMSRLPSESANAVSTTHGPTRAIAAVDPAATTATAPTKRSWTSRNPSRSSSAARAASAGRSDAFTAWKKNSGIREMIKPLRKTPGASSPSSSPMIASATGPTLRRNASEIDVASSRPSAGESSLRCDGGPGLTNGRTVKPAASVPRRNAAAKVMA